MFLAGKYVFAELASIKGHLHKVIVISAGCLTFLLLLYLSDKTKMVCNEICLEVVIQSRNQSH